LEISLGISQKREGERAEREEGRKERERKGEKWGKKSSEGTLPNFIQ